MVLDLSPKFLICIQGEEQNCLVCLGNILINDRDHQLSKDNHTMRVDPLEEKETRRVESNHMVLLLNFIE